MSGLIINGALREISQEQNFTVGTPLYKSMLGTPVYSDLDISAGNYNINGLVVAFNRIRLPKVLFTVTQDKNIVMTKVSGRNGTVKEYIGLDDFSIEIEGMIFGSNTNYPGLDVSNLVNMLNSNQTLQVNSWFLKQFGITDMVIKKYSLPQVEGEISQQKFSIDALSDTPVILKPTNSV